MRLLFLSLLLIFTIDCTPNSEKASSNTNELIFVTSNGPTTYFVNGENQFAGIDTI